MSFLKNAPPPSACSKCGEAVIPTQKACYKCYTKIKKPLDRLSLILSLSGFAGGLLVPLVSIVLSQIPIVGAALAVVLSALSPLILLSVHILVIIAIVLAIMRWKIANTLPAIIIGAIYLATSVISLVIAGGAILLRLT